MSNIILIFKKEMIFLVIVTYTYTVWSMKKSMTNFLAFTLLYTDDTDCTIMIHWWTRSYIKSLSLNMWPRFFNPKFEIFVTSSSMKKLSFLCTLTNGVCLLVWMNAVRSVSSMWTPRPVPTLFILVRKSPIIFMSITWLINNHRYRRNIRKDDY